MSNIIQQPTDAEMQKKIDIQKFHKLLTTKRRPDGAVNIIVMEEGSFIPFVH